MNWGRIKVGSPLRKRWVQLRCRTVCATGPKAAAPALAPPRARAEPPRAHADGGIGTYACGGGLGADKFPPVGGNPSFPKWMDVLCPGVVEHFTRHPYFEAAGAFTTTPTDAAAVAVCTMTLVSTLAASVGDTACVYAGSHLGGLLHAGPIPWDDDVDMAISFRSRDAFAKAAHDYNARRAAGPPLSVDTGHNALKVWFNSTLSVSTSRAWKWPFVDLFFLKHRNGSVYEVNPTGGHGTYAQKYDQSAFFPSKIGYFGGERFAFPNDRIALKRYDPSTCWTANYVHRKEQFTAKGFGRTPVNCCDMKPYFLFAKAPCVYERNGTEYALCAARASLLGNDVDSFAEASEGWMDGPRRTALYQLAPREAQRWRHPLLDRIDVSNVVAPPLTWTDRLRVVVVNVERGGRVIEWAQTLGELEPDVVLMNEADYGMARSDNRHVAQALAAELAMNYAWGIEFVELTPGTKSEAAATRGLNDTRCFTGNAILSKFELSDARILRDPLGAYFDDRPNAVNAKGYERRLGGRMGLFATIRVPGIEGDVVLGNVHKMDSRDGDVRKYVGSRRTIVGGDQSRPSCARWGLLPTTTSDAPTWPASCGSQGRIRGDNACSNVQTVGAETIGLPCWRLNGVDVPLGDHAFLVQDFDLKARVH